MSARKAGKRRWVGAPVAPTSPRWVVVAKRRLPQSTPEPRSSSRATSGAPAREWRKGKCLPFRLLGELAFLHLGEERVFPEEEASRPGADERGDDEEPKLGDRGRIRPHPDERRTARARRVDRGAGDVDADQMDDDEAEANRKARETGRREGMRHAEDGHEEEECSHHLEHESREHVIFAEIARTPAVLPEPARPALRLAGEDDVEHERADDRAGDLGDPVADHLVGLHAPRDEDAEAHRRVHVTARDRADAVGHRDDGEAEGARDAEQVHRRRARTHAADDRRPAAEKHEREGSYEFRKKLVHPILSFSLIDRFVPRASVCLPAKTRAPRPTSLQLAIAQNHIRSDFPSSSSGSTRLNRAPAYFPKAAIAS